MILLMTQRLHSASRRPWSTPTTGTTSTCPTSRRSMNSSGPGGGRVIAGETKLSCARYASCGLDCGGCGRSTRRPSSRSSMACCARPTRCRSWSVTTGGTTTYTRRRRRRHLPPGWQSRPRWRLVDAVAPRQELSSAADLRLPDLLERGDRSVQESVKALLRGGLRQPCGRRRLSGPQGCRWPLRAAERNQYADSGVLPAEYAYQSVPSGVSMNSARRGHAATAARAAR